MKKILGAGLAVAAVAGAVLVGCEVGSPDTTIRQVAIIISGFYRGQLPDELLVSNNTGEPITTLNIIQDGDDLQGIDNNGRVFQGTITSESETAARIVLEGTTTANADAMIQATIDLQGTNATMQGTWVEATIYGNVYGIAGVPAGSGSLTILGASEVTRGTSNTVYTTTEGLGTYTWSVGNTALGSLSNSFGATATYFASSGTGQQTIRVTAGGRSGSKTITQR